MIDILTADRDYYVRTDGDDANTGTTNTSGGAWRTIQHAYDHLASTVFLAGHTVTIQIGPGTFGGLGTARAITGVGLPDDVVLRGSGPSTTVTIPPGKIFCFQIGEGYRGLATMLLDNMRLVADAVVGGGGIGNAGCHVNFGNITFGSVLGSCVEASHHGWSYQVGPVTVEGCPYPGHAYLACASHGIIAVHEQYVDFQGPRTFNGAVAAASAGGRVYTTPMNVYGGLYVSGRPYDVSALAAVDGIANLPGTVAGYCHALGVVS